jgi:hypothetical protein
MEQSSAEEAYFVGGDSKENDCGVVRIKPR